MKHLKYVEMFVWGFAIIVMVFAAVQIFTGPSEAVMFNCGSSNFCNDPGTACFNTNIG
jgi:hypothetical protein